MQGPRPEPQRGQSLKHGCTSNNSISSETYSSRDEARVRAMSRVPEKLKARACFHKGQFHKSCNVRDLVGNPMQWARLEQPFMSYYFTNLALYRIRKEAPMKGPRLEGQQRSRPQFRREPKVEPFSIEDISRSLGAYRIRQQAAMPASKAGAYLYLWQFHKSWNSYD